MANPFFGVNDQTLGRFMKIDEEPHPLNCAVMKICQGGEGGHNITPYESFCRSKILFPAGAIFMYIFLR